MGVYRLKAKTRKCIAGLFMATLIFTMPVSSFAGTKVKAPAKVQITRVSQVNTKATVSWKKLKKSPSGYAVYVKKGSSSWKLAKKVGKTKTKASITVSMYQNNSFKVRAFISYKAKGKTKYAYKYGPYSNTVTLKMTQKNGKAYRVYKVASIPNLQCRQLQNNKMHLSWGKAKYATKYEVFRSDNKDRFDFELIGTTTDLSFDDTEYKKSGPLVYAVRGIGTDTENASEIVHYINGNFQTIGIRPYK